MKGRAKSRRQQNGSTRKGATTKEQTKMRTTGLLLLVFIVMVIMSATSSAEDPTAVAFTTNVTTAGGTVYSFTVLYADDGEIDVNTIGDNDVRVTGPGGFDVASAFVSVNINTNGTPRIATYSIVPPGGSWDFADNGTYNVVMQANAVRDGIGNPVAAGNIGSFTVMTSTSTPTPTPFPGTVLGNISTRLEVHTGDNALIGGFIVTGTQPKKVIVRAIGPSLNVNGMPLPGRLENPTLELDGPGGLIASNDDWRSTQEAEIIATTVQPTNDLESAIVATLPANSTGYTAIVRGMNNSTGIALVEAFDLDRSVDSKLANISTRGFVETVNNVMIGGFIVLGPDPQEVIVRAIGPSLANANPPVAGALPDPMLELRDSNGALLASNDNWQDSPDKQAIIDTDVPPTNDLESAIVATLPSSVSGIGYTAIVSGVNGTTGVALVEVFALAP
jgi:hypothetical protein